MRARIIMLVVGLLIGASLLIGLRLVFDSNKLTHYHANFNVYINGQRLTFDNQLYYEETASCSLNESGRPEHRAHMHQPSNDAVHIHDDGVTWEHFLANIGLTVDSSFIRFEQDAWPADATNKVTFWLNGQVIDSLRNRVIKTEDRLLISYGPEPTDTLKNRFDQVTNSAQGHNASSDPGSCGGSPDWKTRLRQAIF